MAHLDNMTPWSMDDPAQDTVVSVGLRVIWAVDGRRILDQENGAAS